MTDEAPDSMLIITGRIFGLLQSLVVGARTGEGPVASLDAAATEAQLILDELEIAGVTREYEWTGMLGCGCSWRGTERWLCVRHQTAASAS